MNSSTGMSFIFATKSLMPWSCGIKLRGHVGVYFTKGLLNGNPDSLAYPKPWAVPESGIPATKSTSIESLWASFFPHRLRTPSTLMPS